MKHTQQPESFEFSDQFAEAVWRTKYAGEYSKLDEFFADLSVALSLGDTHLAAQANKLFNEKRMAMGGRIFAWAGRKDARVSLMNCTTHAVAEDTLEAITDTIGTVMRASSRGQGIGIDISNLRPRNASVDNAAKTSTGSISFMELISAAGATIGQEGRRSALLFSISDRHPDLWQEGEERPYDFLHVKRTPGHVENANISVRVSDALIEAAEKDAYWRLSFEVPGREEVWNEVKAKALLVKLAESAWRSAEPGILYWDTSVRMSNSDLFGFPVSGVNACLAGSSVIHTTDGWFSIEDLANMSGPLPDVYSFDTRAQCLVQSKVAWVRKTRENAETIDLTSAGIQLTLTPDHKVYTYNRGWVAAENLSQEDDLVHASRGSGLVAVHSITPGNRQDVYDLSVEGKHHNFFANGLLVHNCSEQVLDQDGVCDLGSLNLGAYVRMPFTKEAYFDIVSFKNDVFSAVELLDNVNTIELERGYYISEAQRNSIEQLRRIGLGVMGLADMLAMLRLPYTTQHPMTRRALTSVFETLRNYAYEASVQLARVKGPAPVWDGLSQEMRARKVQKGFFSTLPEYLKKLIVKYGTRNVTILSIAPTGSISNFYGCSSGIEPLYALQYTRRVRMFGGPDQFVDYVHPAVNMSREIGLPDTIWDTAYSVSPEEHIRVCALIQQFVDASVSKTVNYPGSATPEDVYDGYLLAHALGLKGLSVYVDGSRHEQVLYVEKQSPGTCPLCGSETIHQDGCVSCSQCEYSACSV